MEDPTNFVKKDRLSAAAKQRAERGFSDEDWWNFDTYIAWVIAQAVQKFKDDGTTSFYFEGVPPEEWDERTQAEYDVMIKGFGRYVEFQINPSAWSELAQIDNDLEAALEIFKKRFRSLWD